MKELFLKMKPLSRRRTMILSALIIAGLTIGLLAGFVMRPGGPGGNGARGGAAAGVRTVTLARGDLESTVSATGTVYSTKSVEVYSSVNYTVKSVNVSVGDRVSEGDVLAVLDTESLQLDISQKQASLTNSQQSAQQSLATSQQDLQTYKKNVDGNYDTSIINAEAAVTTAEADLISAELDLQNAELDVENSDLEVANAELDAQNAELDVDSANNELRTARRNLRDANNGEGDYEETGIPNDSTINKLKDAVSEKETKLERAQTTLEKSQTTLEKTRMSAEKVRTNLQKAEQNLEKARLNFEKAGVTLDATRKSVSDNLETYQNKVKSAQINTNFDDQYIAVQKLQEDLEKGSVTAPVSGTVTAVNAVQGGSGSGLLFVIQDTDNLKVVSNIKEYDIDSVNIGDNVVIKADATGDREFSGTLSKIAPTSTLTASGSAATSTDAEFETEVKVSTASKGLRIGMNTRLKIITEQRRNVFSVPYEAVKTDEDGSSFIYLMNTGEDGSVAYEKIPVKVGLETNLYVEISGNTLQDGMQIVKNAQDVPESELAESAGAPQDNAGQEKRPDGAPDNSDTSRPAPSSAPDNANSSTASSSDSSADTSGSPAASEPDSSEVK